ncbi:hypothetical protein [Mitsuaria sp. 7]|uniref:hypothetical protein n=1 Tax=Mitsuaria sp. 7 TaxID=1658665 RepID=UPI0007DE08E3|nr:hypothetical protein [Mitsuaria sp. 7]ANH66737.1 hypothetical protein ABE85_02630 [Mitsuaria sp. 7]
MLTRQKKGENFATKEDIGKITDEIKKVEHGYNVMLEEMKSHNTLRVAAVERRLQAHQEAFAMWRKLVVHSKADFHEVLIEVQDWWENNCMYLGKEVSNAFVTAYRNENLRLEYLKIGATADQIIEAAHKVQAFPDIVFAACKLPPLSQEVKDEIIPKTLTEPVPNRE